MSCVRFSKDWQYNACRVLRLESDRLCIDVLPECGGRIYRFIDKSLDRDWLWKHPRIKPAILSPGARYDDTFSGGWDELFPNDAPVTYAGEAYPDHGEYWTRPFDWNMESAPGRATLYLKAEGSVTATRMERWLTIEAGSPVVRIQYRLTNLGGHRIDFLWSLHPALAVTPACELLVPGGRTINGAPGVGRVAPDCLEFKWPM